MKASSEQWIAAEKLAVDEANAQGGVSGRKFELIVEDSQLKPEIAVTKAQKYLLEGKADVIIGAGSNVVVPLQDLTKQYNVPLIMFSQSDQDTGKNFTYNSIRPTFSTEQLARATIGYAAKELKGKKKFYLLNQDFALGHSWAAALKKEVARQIPDAQFVGEDYHPLMSKDLSPYLTKIKMSGADVILTEDWGLDMSVLLKQRRELGVKAVVVGFGLSREIVHENPESALGGYSCMTWFPTSTSKESLDFIESWKRAYKNTDHPIPTDLASRDYIGMKFVLEGIKKAGSTDVNKLMPVLENLRVKTISGEVSMRACDHQLIMPIQCVEIDKKVPPYYSTPVTIPASVTTIPEQEIDNARCKRR